MTKPKLGVPQLWFREGADTIRIVYPDGSVEMQNMWSDEGWMRSEYSESTQILAIEALKKDYFEFIDNLEDT